MSWHKEYQKVLKILNYEKYIDELISRKVFPGITVLIGSLDGRLTHKYFGKFSTVPETIGLAKGTIYDLASLTKPLFTSLVIRMLIETGELNELTDIGKFWGNRAKGINVLQLITHTSGLPAWYPLYIEKGDHIENILKLNKVGKPGQKVVYSCLGYILLAGIVEKITGKEFKIFTKEEVIDKIGLRDTYFDVPKEKFSICAPTESGNNFEREMVVKDHPEKFKHYKWRSYILQGEVHDVNSEFLKGNSGNAGAFSTAEDLFKLSHEFFPEHSTLLKTESVLKFWKNYTPYKRSHRSFGFKLNSSFITSGGRSISKKAIGHSGFTGTSIWMEPETLNIIILLTNRIHPKVDTTINFNKVRRRLHKLIKKDILS